ncbi:hypothetical protein BH10PSE1_BH10PSE1_21690 [soil metagenome]
MSRLFAASLAIVSLMSAAVGVATAQTLPEPPAGLTWFVLNEINSFYLDREDPTNRPALVTEVPAGVLIPVDINRDGLTDWLINWPDASQFCGTGGCERTLYVSEAFAPGEVSDVEGRPRQYGFVRAFDRQGGDLDIREVNGEVRVESSFHHLNCEDTRDDCRLAWGWDPRAGRLVERPSSDGNHIVLSAGQSPIEVFEEKDEGPDYAPPALSELRTAGRKVCPGGDDPDLTVAAYPSLTNIPDLNGDGVRDWVIGAPPVCDGDSDGYSFQVWVSTERGPGPHGEGGAAVMAYQGAPHRWVNLDVAPTPARLIDAPQCDYGKVCPGVTLRWDEATKRLVE